MKYFLVNFPVVFFFFFFGYVMLISIGSKFGTEKTVTKSLT